MGFRSERCCHIPCDQPVAPGRTLLCAAHGAAADRLADALDHAREDSRPPRIPPECPRCKGKLEHIRKDDRDDGNDESHDCSDCELTYDPKEGDWHDYNGDAVDLTSWSHPRDEKATARIMRDMEALHPVGR